MAHIEIRKENYHHNLAYLSQRAGGMHKIMAVLKDNAYGHGLEIMAGLACDFGVRRAAVKTFQEALRIQGLFEEVLILADHPHTKPLPQGVSMGIHELEALEKCHPNSDIHINIDTGMHRNGIAISQIKDSLRISKKNSLHVKGVYAHFRSADELSGEWFWQKSRFEACKEIIHETIKDLDLPMPKFHSCNSAGLLRNSTHITDDYARVGIASYGYTHMPKVFGKHDLRPVMALYAKRLSSRDLYENERIGYAGVYKASKKMKVSTYDIGYGDGFFRYDGFGSLILNNKEVLGRVSMDSMSIASGEDEICLFEDAHYLADHFNTITYDVITKLSSDLPRVVV